MLRVAVLLLIAATCWLAIAVLAAGAKGPPGQVTISGGNLKSKVVIPRPDLIPIDSVGYWEDTRGVPYARTADIPGETPYLVTVYVLVTGGDPQPFLSGKYFPANAGHPDLYEESGSLFKVQPEFGTLLDSHIDSALAGATVAAVLPAAGGPPANERGDVPTYEVLVAGALLLLASAAAMTRVRR